MLMLIVGFTFAVEWNVVGVEVFVFMFICILDIATSLVVVSFADAFGVGVEGEVEGDGIPVMEGTAFASVSLLVSLFGLRRRFGRGRGERNVMGGKGGVLFGRLFICAVGPAATAIGIISRPALDWEEIIGVERASASANIEKWCISRLVLSGSREVRFKSRVVGERK
jgi:hypothetical protein